MSFSFWREAETAAIRAAIAWLDKDPVNRLLKLIHLLQSADPRGILKKQLDDMKYELERKEGVVYELIIGIFSEVDAAVRTRMIENFLMNALHVGSPDQEAILARFQKKIPWLLFSDPYDVTEELPSFAAMRSVMTEAKKQGIGLFTFPDSRWGSRLSDVFRLAEENSDLLFAVIVKPECVSEEVIRTLLRVKNTVLLLQDEAGEAYLNAVNALQKQKAPFGVSVVSSDPAELETVLQQKLAQKIRQVLFLAERPLEPEVLQKLDAWVDAYRRTHPLMTVGLWEKADGSLYLPLGVGTHPEECLAIRMKDLK